MSGIGKPMTKKRAATCLILHKKSCMRPEVKAAIKHVQQSTRLDVCIPWRGKDLRKFVSRAIEGGARRIIAGGGDGTINAVVNAMMRKGKALETSLGILPLGTANDFARGAGIDGSDLTAALELACAEEPTKIDLGWMNGRYFINVASAGFGAEITATTPQDIKKVLGGVAYTLMGLVKAFQLQPYKGRVVFADGTVEEGSMLIMAVGNSRFAGGGYDVAPKASLTDGMLDIAVVSGQKPESLGDLVSESRDPMNLENKHLLYRQLAAFTIETEKPLHVNLDGEPIIGDRFEFKCCPKALAVVLGDTSETGVAR
jgi:lipid kinase YegS